MHDEYKDTLTNNLGDLKNLMDQIDSLDKSTGLEENPIKDYMTEFLLIKGCATYERTLKVMLHCHFSSLSKNSFIRYHLKKLILDTKGKNPSTDYVISLINEFEHQGNKIYIQRMNSDYNNFYNDVQTQIKSLVDARNVVVHGRGHTPYNYDDIKSYIDSCYNFIVILSFILKEQFT